MTRPLTNTAYVILGVLQYGPKSGYDIKARVDISTRFFFSASYGQIYPELKRLRARKLVIGSSHKTGRRERTVYEITEAGRERLRDWMLSPGASIEMRDEGMLKIFFSGTLSREEQAGRVDALRSQRQEQLENWLAIQNNLPPEADDIHRAVLEIGIEQQRLTIAWCEGFAKERKPG